MPLPDLKIGTLKVMAFDPGITTGIASGLISLPDGLMEVGATQEVLTVGALFDLLEKQEPNCIVFETFEFRQRARKGLSLFPKELIGVIELYGSRKGDEIHIHRQNAAQGKTYFTDRQLKDNNVYRPGMPHANDAMRHLLQWFTFGPGYKFNKQGYRPA